MFPKSHIDAISETSATQYSVSALSKSDFEVFVKAPVTKSSGVVIMYSVKDKINNTRRFVNIDPVAFFLTFTYMIYRFTIVRMKLIAKTPLDWIMFDNHKLINAITILNVVKADPHFKHDDLHRIEKSKI